MNNQLISLQPPKLNKAHPIILDGASLTETVSNGFITIDSSWIVRSWNKPAEILLGVEARNIIGKNFWDHFVNTLPLEFYKYYHKAFLSNNPTHFTEFWNEKGIWIDAILFPSDNLLTVSFKFITHNVSPGQLEKKLRVLTDLYRRVTEVTNDCIWEWDIQANQLFWVDGQHKKLFGYDIENALVPQKFWENHIHPSDKGRVLKKLSLLIKESTDETWEIEYRFKKADGKYAFVHDFAQVIYDDKGLISRMVGSTQDITQNVVMGNRLIKEQTAQKFEIVNAVLTALENERSDIGKELHDNLGQLLVIAKMYLQMASNSKEVSRDIYLEKSLDLIVKVVEELRKISKELIVPDVNIIGLFDNIRNTIQDLKIIQQKNFTFSPKNIKEDEISAELQLTTFRIVQEQINNILKHSECTDAGISIKKQGSNLKLEISDNGSGCNLNSGKKGVGIINIKSRAELYGGEAKFESSPGHGFRLTVLLPLKGQKVIFNPIQTKK
jgi:PAS domain S-box-containing protein